MPHKPDSVLLPEEISWLGAPLQRASNKKNPSRPCSNPEWRLWIPEQDFQKWWKNQGKATIFFDGASKGNPGISGAGGVIYSSDSQSKDSFSWGLGKNTNNQAEILGLLKACQLAQGNGEKYIQVFGDSEILIKILNSGEFFNNPTLNKTLQRLRKVTQNFTSIFIYHIL
jgi:ribonuclease HI